MVKETKTCTRCGQTKPLEEFPLVGARAPGKYRANCIECRRALGRKEHIAGVTDYEAYLRKRNSQKLVRKYGMDEEQRNEYIASRGDKCEVCLGTRDEVRDGTLCIDHDHSCCPGEYTCGECLRGVLCINCNIALGNLQDDINVVGRLVTYLEVSNGRKRRISGTG